MRIREAFVQDAVQSWLLSSGCEVRTQVPILGRIADVYGVNGSGRSLAIECKERDWGRALGQARRYCGAADLAYIALPAVRITKSAISAARVHGIGVLGVETNGSVLELSEPRVAPYLHRALRDRVSERTLNPAGAD